MAPHEHVSLFDLPSEEVLIFARPKLRVESLRTVAEKLSLQQDVASPTLSPIDHKARRVAGPVIKLALDDPLRWLVLKMWLHRPKNAISPVLVERLEQGQQPAFDRKFVIVDEGNQITFGVLYGFVPR